MLGSIYKMGRLLLQNAFLTKWALTRVSYEYIFIHFNMYCCFFSSNVIISNCVNCFFEIFTFNDINSPCFYSLIYLCIYTGIFRIN